MDKPEFDEGPWHLFQAGGQICVANRTSAPKTVDEFFDAMLIRIDGKNAEATARLVVKATEMYWLLDRLAKLDSSADVLSLSEEAEKLLKEIRQ